MKPGKQFAFLLILLLGLILRIYMLFTVGLNRYNTYAKQGNDSNHPLYVYFSGTKNEREFRNFLDASGITYDQSGIDRYVIYSNLSSHVKYPLGTP